MARPSGTARDRTNSPSSHRSQARVRTTPSCRGLFNSSRVYDAGRVCNKVVDAVGAARDRGRNRNQNS